MSDLIVVTGATGFLGRRLVEILRENGKSVIALGRNEIQGQFLNSIGATFVNCSLSDVERLASVIPEGASVVHSAALSTPWGKYKDFYESNVMGTRNIADAALKKNVKRFVHISTPSVYVDKKSQFQIKESDPLPKSGINDYAKTKLLAEKEVDQKVREGLRAITLRPQGIFGPKDPSILPRLIRVAKKGFIPVIGNEKVMIDLTHVDNVCEAILRSLSANDTCIGKKYNITNGEPIEQLPTLLSLLQGLGFEVKEKRIRLATATLLATGLEGLYRAFSLPGEPLLTRYSVYTLAHSRTLSIEAAKKELNYIPKINMNDGIAGYIEWYKKSAS